jgi:hypothetical protein
MIKGHVKKKEMLRIGISYMICIPHTEWPLHQWKRGLVLFLEWLLAFLAIPSHR